MLKHQGLISTIVNDFRSTAAFHEREEGLFRHLAESLKKTTNATVIHETHGNIALVDFQSQFNSDPPCEISDWLIVSRDKSQNLYRATFWQAKKQSKTKWSKFPSERRNFDFKGQLNQWELLATRPQVEGVKGFNIDPDILAGATSSSIGSFGVFHEVAGEIQLNYSVAELVTAATPVKAPKLVINQLLNHYCLNESECLVAIDIEHFLDALLRFRIGAYLDLDASPGKWLAGYVSRRCRESDLPDFMEGIVNRTNDISVPDESGEGGGFSILMLEAESDS